MGLSIFFSQKHINAKAAVFILLAGIQTLTACNSVEKESSISLSDDGAVASAIVEDFDKSYYDKDELQQMILEEVASYNRNSGKWAVTVDKVSVEDGIARVKMTYASSEDYAAFNDGDFFVGTVREAQDAGYDLNRVLVSVSDSLDTVGMSDMLAMKDVKILITDMKETISLDGRALYTSSNVAADRRCKTVSIDEASEEMAYIIYK